MKLHLIPIKQKNKCYFPGWQIQEIPGLVLSKDRGNATPWHLDKDEELSRYIQWDVWDNPASNTPNHLWDAIKVGKLLERQRFSSKRKALQAIKQAWVEAKTQPNPVTKSTGMTSLYL